MSYSDEYDEFSELPIDHQSLSAYSVHERTVRRRSSKGDLSVFLYLNLYILNSPPQPFSLRSMPQVQM